jgi:hypothetical protein
VEINAEALTQEKQNEYLSNTCSTLALIKRKHSIFMGDELVSTDTYSPEDENINILDKDGTKWMY